MLRFVPAAVAKFFAPCLSCGVACFLLAGCSETLIGKEPANMRREEGAQATSPSDPNFERTNWMRDVPMCKKNHGTVALLEQDNDFQGFGGPQNATPMLRYLLQKSGCFTVVERGPAIAKFDTERGYSEKEPGLPGYRRLDYLLTARVVFQDTRSNDGMASASRSFITSLGDASNINVSLSMTSRVIEMNAVLLLTNVRTSVQVLAEQGSASKTDMTVNSFSGYGFDNLSSKTMAAALFDAYARMVAQLNSEKFQQRRKRG